MATPTPFASLIDSVRRADCVDYMATLPDASVDLVVTSPPYDTLRDYEGYAFDFPAVVAGLWRVVKQGGVVVWVVNDAVVDGSETCTSFRHALCFRSAGFRLHDTMIFSKKGLASLPSSNRYYPKFEYMFVFSKGAPKTFHPINDRPNKEHGNYKPYVQRMPDGVLRVQCKGARVAAFGRRFNIWEYGVGAGKGSRDAIAFEHPATFPDALAADHIRSWSDVGDVVFDPFSGSGTTAKMAKSLGRRFLACDISATYVRLARKRLRMAA